MVSTSTNSKSETITLGIQLGLLFLSASTLTFEISLTRLFAVAQFYHFAFLIISIALLGYGASGTTLAIFPGMVNKEIHRTISRMAIFTAISILAGLLLIIHLPFNSFTITWDWRQSIILLLQNIVLALPFYFTGLCVGILMTRFPKKIAGVYAINLLGSSVGCAVALITPQYLGGEGTILSCVFLSTLASILAIIRKVEVSNSVWKNTEHTLLIIFLIFFATLTLNWNNISPNNPIRKYFQLKISPYKGLSYILQYPGSEIIFQKWNSITRVDLVRSRGIRSLPGLSYRFAGKLPPQDGLFIDGDDMSPVLISQSDKELFDLVPNAITFHLRPEAEVLVLEPRGGMDIHTSLQLGAKSVTAIEMNPLIVEAAQKTYQQPNVNYHIESDRSFLQRSLDSFDIIILSLASSFHPIRSGAYSLAEDYRYTVEAFQDSITHLKPEGIFVVTRWLQDPPSECLRTFALAVTALERLGLHPEQQIVAYRGYNTITFLIKKEQFTSEELEEIRTFTADRAFDLVYTPDINPNEVNQYNILPSPIYFQSFQDLIIANPRSHFYSNYPYDVSPPTDDKPFFGHFFKFSQAKQLFAEIGKIWQPFGGAGFLVVIALLLVAISLSLFFIILPVVVNKINQTKSDTKSKAYPISLSKIPSVNRHTALPLLYFALLGFAFLLVEIPLIQKFILYLNHPATAFTTVLFTLLLFSGIGSLLSNRLPLGVALGLLVILLLIEPLLLPLLFQSTLGYPLESRIVLTVLVIAPLGILMGIPFPAGLQQIARGDDNSSIIPWIWAINGSCSVISAIIAALFAITFGFSFVLRLGSLCYFGAWIMVVTVWQSHFGLFQRQ